MSKEKPNTGRILMILGGLLVLASVFLPWIDLYKENIVVIVVKGSDLLIGKTSMSYGVIALIVGGVYAGRAGKSYSLVMTFIACVGIFYLSRIYEKFDAELMMRFGFLVKYGLAIGWYLSNLGMFLILFGGTTKVPDKNI